MGSSFRGGGLPPDLIRDSTVNNLLLFSSSQEFLPSVSFFPFIFKGIASHHLCYLWMYPRPLSCGIGLDKFFVFEIDYAV
jgi:hypothetical protein